mmetsp:Transcript_21981/g.46749  ORF Transcript_21981/g.46749 Transcript_21981/m.46749 type:complete len:308 (-) Transcript_21981:13-936(-)
MCKLSRDQAVSLSAELHDVVVKLRVLEAKYGLEDQSEAPWGLGVNLLAALQPYGQDPEVVGNALRAGLKLPPGDCLPAPAFLKQVSQESISELSTTWGSRKTSGGSLQSERSGTEDLDLTPALGRKLLVVPVVSSMPGRWTFSVEHRSVATVAELRRQLAVNMQMPLGKMLIMAEADGEAVALGDDEGAERATTLFARSVAASLQTTGQANAGTSCTLEQALAMQQDFLDSLASGNQPVSTERLKEVQTSILLRYGMKSGPGGLAAMLCTFDQYASDAAIRSRGEQINQMLGMRPQVYNLQVTESGA